jgi:hypothetical protein
MERIGLFANAGAYRATDDGKGTCFASALELPQKVGVLILPRAIPSDVNNFAVWGGNAQERNSFQPGAGGDVGRLETRYGEPLLLKLGDYFIGSGERGAWAVDEENFLHRLIQRMTFKQMQHHALRTTATARKEMQRVPSARALVPSQTHQPVARRAKGLMIRHQDARKEGDCDCPESKRPLLS